MNDLTRDTLNISKKYPVKVLQFGEGNFLRGFVDWIIDILNEKSNFSGAVQVIQPIEQGIGDLINAQDGLYHVILQGLVEGSVVDERRLITCVHGVNNPYQDYEVFLQLAENPALEFIFSNTTEAGIAFLPHDNNIDTLPASFPGKLTALLYRRFLHFDGAPTKGLTIIPCELIDKNGDCLKGNILDYVKHWNLPTAFRRWIMDHNTFCNSLVDRIVPGFPKDTIVQLQEQLNFKDNLVVKAEPFHLWVIEGSAKVKAAFPTDKAGLEVLFVQDLSPYRTRKVRILNGAHTALVPVAYLHGLRTVKEAVEDKNIGVFLRKTIFQEIIPTLDLPTAELEKFANDVIERFLNPFIRHELSAIALNSISKFKVRVLPSLLAYQTLKHDLPQNLAHSLAALLIFYRGNWRGEETPVADSPEVISIMQQAWREPVHVVHHVLANVALWDQDLTLVKGLEACTQNHLEILLKMEKSVSSDSIG